MQRLTLRAIKRIKGNHRVIGKLMAFFDKSPDTIQRWIKDNDVRLTLPGAVQIIQEGTGLEDEQIVETGAASAA
jgi:hypothetical protein